MLSAKEVLEQSKAAFNQWKDQWIENAKVNGEIKKQRGTRHKDIMFMGAGRICVCAGLAPSLEDNFELIKKYKTDAIDIACVDKALGIFLDRGVKPKIVIVCDANVNYETYMEPWKDQTDDIILGMCITANPKWAQNWKGTIVFFTNKDNINSQENYLPYCDEMIPAGSNVGNSILIFTTQLCSYDEYLLVGFDYCWKEGNYYAFSDPGKKRYWMKHIQMIDRWGYIVNTSQNLLFSARWLADFHLSLKQKGLKNIWNCCGSGILNIPKANFEKKLKHAKIRKLSDEEKTFVLNLKADQAIIKPEQGADVLQQYLSKPVVDVIVRYVPQETAEWIVQL